MARPARELWALHDLLQSLRALAYLCFNRGVQMIGANRAAPFFHVVPVFGSAMAIVFLGARPQLFHIVGFALVVIGVFVASRKPANAS